GSSSTSSWCPAVVNAAKSGQDGTGSCACPDGGDLAWDLEGLQSSKQSLQSGGPVDVTVRVLVSGCRVKTAEVDGSEFVKMKSRGTPSAKDLLLLEDIHLSATNGSVHAQIDADFEFLDGKMWLSVSVNDGNVAVATAAWDSSTKTGTITVRDRNATWTCT